MQESNFMMTLLIPGPRSPGKHFDVFLQLLVEDLLALWSSVDTVDALIGKKNSSCDLPCCGAFMTIQHLVACLVVPQKFYLLVYIVTKILCHIPLGAIFVTMVTVVSFRGVIVCAPTINMPLYMKAKRSQVHSQLKSF
jgi:hypothetical protein